MALWGALERTRLSADLNSAISTTVHSFTHEAQQQEHSRWLTGPVATATRSVEDTALNTVHTILEDAYRRDMNALERAIGQKLPRRRKAAFGDGPTRSCVQCPVEAIS